METIDRLAGRIFRTGWLDLENPTVSEGSHRKPLPRSLARRLLQTRNRTFFRSRGTLSIGITIDRRIRLFVSATIPRPSTLYANLRGILFAASVGVLIGALGLGTFGLPFFLSLRLQLMLMFGVVGLASGGTLLGFSHAYLEFRTEAFVQQSRERAFQILEKVDRSFLPAFQRISRRYLAMVRRIERKRGRVEQILKPLEKAISEGWVIGAFLVNREGKFLYRRSRILAAFKTILNQGTEKLFGGLGMELIRRNSGEFGLSDEGEDLNMYSNILGKSFFRDALRTHGALLPVKLGMESIYLFTEFIQSPAGRTENALLILHDPRVLETRFLDSIRSRFARNAARTSFTGTLAVIPREGTRGLRTFPRGFFRTEEAARLTDFINQNGNPGSDIGRHLGMPSLICGLPGSNIKDFHLFLISPLQPILDQSQSLSIRFLAFSLLAAGFALALGSLLARDLLGPIRELGMGLERLSASVFNQSGRDLDQ